MPGTFNIILIVTDVTRASERKHSWAARLTPRWPQFPVLQLNGSRPQLSLHKCMTYSNCKRKKLEIRSASSLQGVISGHYLPKFTWKVYQKWNQLKSVRTLLRITHIAHMKSYLVIICPNSYNKMTRNEIRSSWSWFEYWSKSLV